MRKGRGVLPWNQCVQLELCLNNYNFFILSFHLSNARQVQPFFPRLSSVGCGVAALDRSSFPINPTGKLHRDKVSSTVSLTVQAQEKKPFRMNAEHHQKGSLIIFAKQKP